MNKFTELYKLNEALKINNAMDIIEAIKNGEMVKNLNGKKNLPAWIKEAVDTNDKPTIDFLLDTFETLIQDIHKFLGERTGGTEYNEAVFLLIKKSVDKEAMSKIMSNSKDALINVAQSSTKAWYKGLPIVQKVNNEPYNPEVWHDLEKSLQDKLSTTRQRMSANKKANIQTETDSYVIIYQDDNWVMAKPKTQEGDAWLASNMKEFDCNNRYGDESKTTKTQWCTAAGSNFYERYSEDGNGYYVVKTPGMFDAENAWQIAFCSTDHVEFMDKYDEREFYNDFISKAPDALLDKIVIDNPKSVLKGISLLWLKQHNFKLDENNLDSSISLFHSNTDYGPEYEDEIRDSYDYDNDPRIDFAIDNLKQNPNLTENSRKVIFSSSKKDILSLIASSSDINMAIKLIDTFKLDVPQILNLNVSKLKPINVDMILSLNLPMPFKVYLLKSIGAAWLKDGTMKLIKSPGGTELLRNWIFFNGSISEYSNVFDTSILYWASEETPEKIRALFSPLKNVNKNRREWILNNIDNRDDYSNIDKYIKDNDYILKNISRLRIVSYSDWCRFINRISKLLNTPEPVESIIPYINLNIDYSDSNDMYILDISRLYTDRFTNIYKFLKSSNKKYSIETVKIIIDYVDNYVDNDTEIAIPLDIIFNYVEATRNKDNELDKLNKLFATNKNINIEAERKYNLGAYGLESFSNLNQETQQFFIEHDFRPGLINKDMESYVQLVKEGKINPDIQTLNGYQKDGANRAIYRSKAYDSGLIDKDSEIYGKNDYLAKKYVKEHNIVDEDLARSIEYYIRNNGLDSFNNISDFYLENYEYISPEDIDNYGKELCQKYVDNLKKFGKKGKDVRIMMERYNDLINSGASQEEIDNEILDRASNEEYYQLSNQDRTFNNDNFYDYDYNNKQKYIQAINDYKRIPNIVKPENERNKQDILKALMENDYSNVVKALLQFKKQNKKLNEYYLPVIAAEPGSFDKYDTIRKAINSQLQYIPPAMYATKNADEIINAWNRNNNIIKPLELYDWNTGTLLNMEFESPLDYNKIVDEIKRINNNADSSRSPSNKVENLLNNSKKIKDVDTLIYYERGDFKKNYGIYPQNANFLGIESLKKLLQITHLGGQDAAYRLGSNYSSGNVNTDISKAYFNKLTDSIIQNIELYDELFENKKLSLYRLNNSKINLVLAYVNDIKTNAINPDTDYDIYSEYIINQKNITPQMLELNRQYLNKNFDKELVEKYVYFKHPNISEKDIQEFKELQDKYNLRRYDFDYYIEDKQDYLRFLQIYRLLGFYVDDYSKYIHERKEVDNYFKYKEKGGKLEYRDYVQQLYMEESFKEIYRLARI